MRLIEFSKNGECVSTVSKLENKIFANLQETINPKLKKLYVEGEFCDTDFISLAVVGSRKISEYGRRVCDFIVKDLAAAGVTIVSGLMYGVDQSAHRAALSAGGRTIAVLGYGMNQLSTNKNTKDLAEKIVNTKSGVLLSEYDPNYPPTQYTFPTRNRIIAGISMATLVVEAAENSGSKITAGFAATYGKDVFVVPGSIFSSVSKGKHALLKEGAIPVDSAKDILDYLGVKAKISKKTENSLTREQKLVFDEINNASEIRLDELSETLGLQVVELNTILTSLELSGLIKRKLDGRIVPS